MGFFNPRDPGQKHPCILATNRPSQTLFSCAYALWLSGAMHRKPSFVTTPVLLGKKYAYSSWIERKGLSMVIFTIQETSHRRDRATRLYSVSMYTYGIPYNPWCGHRVASCCNIYRETISNFVVLQRLTLGPNPGIGGLSNSYELSAIPHTAKPRIQLTCHRLNRPPVTSHSLNQLELVMTCHVMLQSDAWNMQVLNTTQPQVEGSSHTPPLRSVKPQT